jgi:hypothetical protein
MAKTKPPYAARRPAWSAASAGPARCLQRLRRVVRGPDVIRAPSHACMHQVDVPACTRVALTAIMGLCQF